MSSQNTWTDAAMKTAQRCAAFEMLWPMQECRREMGVGIGKILYMKCLQICRSEGREEGVVRIRLHLAGVLHGGVCQRHRAFSDPVACLLLQCALERSLESFRISIFFPIDLSASVFVLFWRVWSGGWLLPDQIHQLGIVCFWKFWRACFWCLMRSLRQDHCLLLQSWHLHGSCNRVWCQELQREFQKLLMHLQHNQCSVMIVISTCMFWVIDASRASLGALFGFASAKVYFGWLMHLGLIKCFARVRVCTCVFGVIEAFCVACDQCCVEKCVCMGLFFIFHASCVWWIWPTKRIATEQIEEGEVDTERSRQFSQCYRKAFKREKDAALEQTRGEKKEARDAQTRGGALWLKDKRNLSPMRWCAATSESSRCYYQVPVREKLQHWSGLREKRRQHGQCTCQEILRRPGQISVGWEQIPHPTLV